MGNANILTTWSLMSVHSNWIVEIILLVKRLIIVRSNINLV